MRANAAILQLCLDSDLVESGWDGSKTPYPGQSVHQFEMMALSGSLLKKYRDEVSEDAERLALAKFLRSNELCKSFELGTGETEVDALMIGEFCESIARFFASPIFNRSFYEDHFGVGPGSSLGSPTTSFFSKIANSRLTFDKPELPFLFREAISSEATWSETETARSRCGSEMVVGNVLSHVPKTRDITRTICTEPLLNMLYQKGIGAAIESRLVSFFGIRLDRQPAINVKMARLGSERSLFSTIDLESASDSISMNLLSKVLPSHVLTWLKIARSANTILPSGEVIELHMVSSMGNAFTFPLETAIFACAVAAVYRVRNIPFTRCDSEAPNFGVFGDDITCLPESFNSVVRLLSLLGFRVNSSKSFNTGDFRESCGGDFYRGKNVRGVYITTLRTVQDVYSSINRLNLWSSRHKIPLKGAIMYLHSALPKKVLYVPFWESDTAGLKVPFRFCNNLRNKNGSFVYYANVPIPISFPVADVEARPPKMRGYFANPAGLMMAVLGGYCFGGTLTVRPNGAVRYRIQRRISPGWDCYADDPDFPGQSDDWKVITPINLFGR